MMLSPGAIAAVSEILEATDFYRESHCRIYRAALSLYGKGEPVDAITLVDELEERGRSRGRWGTRADPRARSARTGHRERRPLRPDHPRGGHAAGAHPGGRRDLAARLGRDRARPTELVDRAEQIIFDLSQQRVSRRLRAHRAAAEGELRAHHRPLRVRRRRDRRPLGLPRSRPAHVGLPAGQPRRRRCPAEHGEVGVRSRRRRQPGCPSRDPRGHIHARDVEGRGHPAADVQRGEGRVPAAPNGPPGAGGLATPDGGMRQAGEGARRSSTTRAR